MLAASHDMMLHICIKMTGRHTSKCDSECADTHLEVVVPGASVGHHVEAHEAVRQQQLHLLVVVGRVPHWVGCIVLVGSAPLVAVDASATESAAC